MSVDKPTDTQTDITENSTTLLHYCCVGGD